MIDAAASPSSPVDVDALYARAQRSRVRGRLVVGLCAIALAAVTAGGVLATLRSSDVELTSPPPSRDAAEPGWPLRLRAEAVLSPPGADAVPLMIEMTGEGWDDWLAIIAHGPTDTEVSVDILTSKEGYGRAGVDDWAYSDEPFALLERAAEAAADAEPLLDSSGRDFWGSWWQDTRPELVPHAAPHPLLRPWAATAAGMADPPADKTGEWVTEQAPDATWEQRQRDTAERFAIEPAALALRSWETGAGGECASERRSDCLVTITALLLGEADVPLFVEITGGGGWVGRLEVTHLELADHQTEVVESLDASAPAAPAEPVALVGLWEVRDAAGETAGAVLRLDAREVNLFRGCGAIFGGWAATHAGAFLAQPGGWSSDCGDAPWPRWLADAAAHRPDGDGHVLLDAAGDIVARLVPGSEPQMPSNVAQSVAEPPIVTAETRAALAAAEPLPADLRPAVTDTVVGRWTPSDAPPGSQAHAHFHPDDRFSTSDGCNGLGGRWRLDSEGGLLTVSGGVMTAAGCENVPVGERLTSTARAGLTEGGELVLFDRQGEELGRFHRSTCQPTAPVEAPERVQYFGSAQQAAGSVPGLPSGGTLIEDGASEWGAAFTWVVGTEITHRIYLDGGAEQWSLNAYERCD